MGHSLHYPGVASWSRRKGISNTVACRDAQSVPGLIGVSRGQSGRTPLVQQIQTSLDCHTVHTNNEGFTLKAVPTEEFPRVPCVAMWKTSQRARSVCMCNCGTHVETAGLFLQPHSSCH